MFTDSSSDRASIDRILFIDSVYMRANYLISFFTVMIAACGSDPTPDLRSRFLSCHLL
jgi:hypothetical protein